LDGVLAGEDFSAGGLDVVRAAVLVALRGKAEGEVDILLSNIPVVHLFLWTLSSEEDLVAGVDHQQALPEEDFSWSNMFANMTSEKHHVHECDIEIDMYKK
jgi:hypothetical protein